jgi:hypothetical protein
VLHWKAGHKHECARLAAEAEAEEKAEAEVEAEATGGGEGREVHG